MPGGMTWDIRKGDAVMPDKIKIAAVQTNPKITKNKENLDKVLLEIEAAAKSGADLIVFPECALSG